jgi:hypothetical protein
MIHTLKIDDSRPTGKRLINELKKHRKTVVFENPAISGVAPQGYMTLEDFRVTAKESARKILNDNGIC